MSDENDKEGFPEGCIIPLETELRFGHLAGAGEFDGTSVMLLCIGGEIRGSKEEVQHTIAFSKIAWQQFLEHCALRTAQELYGGDW